MPEQATIRNLSGNGLGGECQFHSGKTRYDKERNRKSSASLVVCPNGFGDNQQTCMEQAISSCVAPRGSLLTLTSPAAYAAGSVIAPLPGLEFISSRAASN